MPFFQFWNAPDTKSGSNIVTIIPDDPRKAINTKKAVISDSLQSFYFRVLLLGHALDEVAKAAQAIGDVLAVKHKV